MATCSGISSNQSHAFQNLKNGTQAKLNAASAKTAKKLAAAELRQEQRVGELATQAEKGNSQMVEAHTTLSMQVNEHTTALNEVGENVKFYEEWHALMATKLTKLQKNSAATIDEVNLAKEAVADAEQKLKAHAAVEKDEWNTLKKLMKALDEKTEARAKKAKNFKKKSAHISDVDARTSLNAKKLGELEASMRAQSSKSIKRAQDRFDV
jgi:hypothetical protein